MKTLLKHLGYIAAGAGVIAFLVGIQWAFDKILWPLYIDHYFFAVNLTIVVIVMIALCWFFGRFIVSDFGRR